MYPRRLSKPENNVLSIESVITLEGTNYSNNPSIDEFYSFNNRWFEVPALAENKVFVEDTNTLGGSVAGVVMGVWKKIEKKFRNALAKEIVSDIIIRQRED